jgi:hypothetical protein
MSDWNELQKEAKELGVLERGMTMKETEQAVMDAKRRGRDDTRTEPRKERRPLGGLRFNLEVPEHLKQPGFHYRFFTEKNVPRALDAGYIPVLSDGSEYDRETDAHRSTDSWYMVAKGYVEDGNQTKASVNYLMKQPMAFYEEDQAYRHSKVDDIEKALKRGNPTGQEDENVYIPDGGSALQSTREMR